MAAEYLLVPPKWRRILAWTRVALVTCALVVYLLQPGASTLAIAFLLLPYLMFLVGGLISVRWEQAGYHPVAVAVQASLVAIAASHPAPLMGWLGLSCSLHLLLSAALFMEANRVAAVGAVSLLLLIGSRPAHLNLLWPALLVAGVLAWLLAEQRSELQERLSAAHRRSVLARADAEIARTVERERIAHDFHDGPLQSFISFQMRLEILRRMLLRDAESARTELEQLQELVRTQSTELRNFIQNMHTQAEQSGSLDSALRQLMASFQKDTGTPVQLNAPTLDRTLDGERATEVFQIVREALNNVQKHSHASHVAVTLRSGEEGISIQVEDDGSGFPFTGLFSLQELDTLRMGPASIKKRVHNLSGQMSIESKPGLGSALRVTVPL